MATKKSKAPAEKPAKSTEDILAVMRERFDLAALAEADSRKDELDDLKFLAGEQWPVEIKAARELDNRPCLKTNTLPQFKRQVTNDQRQNRSSIKVSPVDDKADIETAKIFQGMIRHIEYNSNADVAYDTAFEGAVSTGLGYLRVVTGYCDANSFDQEILIKRIRNRFTVYVDPDYQEPDGSDMNWATIFTNMGPDDYRAQYGDSELGGMREWTSVGDSMPGWINDKYVRVAEYFYKTFKKVTLAQLSDGTVIEKTEFVAGAVGQDGAPITILKEREATLPAIKWIKTNGYEILEETDWLGKWIPIIPVLGDEMDLDGKRILTGIIRHAKDPQRMRNYWQSAATEMIALAPRAPFIVAAGQLTGFEKEWASANTRNHSKLEYNPKAINGTLAPPPQRQSYEPNTQAITQQLMQSADDMKATTGIYDASLGARSNENSGIAIQRRNVQAQTNNFHYIDNLSRAMRHLGRILVDLIPHIYDTPRAVRTLGEDGEQEIVRINEVFEKQGKNVAYMLGAGKYDVTVSSGPSFQTKRQESAAAMLELAKSTPQLMVVAPDLVMKALDFPGADGLAARFEKTLAPGLKDDKEKQPIPPEAQQQLTQMGQMIEAMTEQLNAANDERAQKVLELESKERIEFKKLEVAVELKMAEMGSKESLALLQHEIAQIGQRLEMLQIGEPIENENENLSGEGQQQVAPPQDQPPTDGFSSGQNMGV